MKRIVAYGDSWTVGEGCNREIEDTLSKHEKIIYQKENSWVKHLSDKLGLPYQNNGISGNPNNVIFNQIVDDIKSGETTKNDLVVIMWSSSLRDYLPFFPKGPKGEWLSWSTKHLMETPDRFFTSTQTQNRYYDFFMEDYKKFYLLNLYNENYYSIVNQNYIVFLQEFFKHYKISHIFIDGIEDMFMGILPHYDKTDLIDGRVYWEFRKQTARGYLNTFNRVDLWEHTERWDTRGTQHPNSEGYRLLSDEFYRFIDSQKKLFNKVFISMAKQQSTDFVMFGEKKLSDLFGEIYSNQHSEKQKISDLIEEFKKQIRHAGDIASIGPVIKDLVKFSVENDDILIRLATIGQRFVAMEYKGTNDGGLLSDKEKEELLGELEKISKDVQAKTMDKVDDIEYELEEIQRKLEQTKK